MKNEHKIQMRKPKGKRPLGTLDVDGWIILNVSCCDSVDWIHATQDRLQWRDAVNKPSGSIKHKIS
jgi:hypothetical protein